MTPELGLEGWEGNVPGGLASWKGISAEGGNSFHLTMKTVPGSLLCDSGEAEVAGTQSGPCRCSKSEVNRK